MTEPTLPSTGVSSTMPALAAVTVKVLVAEAAETLPARSVAVALTVCVPAASAEVSGEAPGAGGVGGDGADDRAVDDARVTVLKGSAVPRTVGRRVASASSRRRRWCTTGAAGAVVSTVKVLVFDRAASRCRRGSWR